MKAFRFVVLAMAAISLLACPTGIGSNGEIGDGLTYSLTYDGNGFDTGTVPGDDGRHAEGDTVTVASCGSMARTGHSFSGWNTEADGTGTVYAEGSNLEMPAADVILYAQWTANQYSVAYDGNGATDGAVPVDGNSYTVGSSVSVADQSTLSKSGYTFAGWNTEADGSGTSRAPGSTFAMPAGNVTLYARWTADDYTVSYDGNGATGGDVPVDGSSYTVGDTVSVANPSTLDRTGHSFSAWNTESDGSGTTRTAGSTFAMPGTNVTLYAQWTPNDYAITYDGNGSDGGTVPPPGTYTYQTSATIADPGTMSLTDKVFTSWNTLDDGTGDDYSPGATIQMPANDVTLYAQWETASGTQTSDAAEGIAFHLRYVRPGDYYVGGITGDHDYTGMTNVTIGSGYWVGETEVTYELWYAVRSWAESSGGYSFANSGREGHDGTDGAIPTTANQEPVTSINWRDAMIFCNALSEAAGKTPVYYTDSGYTTPCRNSSSVTELQTSAGAMDNPYVNWNADGYRLPTEAEREIAGRGGDLQTGYGTSYPGSNTIGDVAWYVDNAGGTTHAVAGLAANEIGLYDMVGNVSEWQWDWYGLTYPSGAVDPKGAATGSSRMRSGGGFTNNDAGCSLGYRMNDDPYDVLQSYGLRVIRKGE
jgi:uncharacterized repeat protein (TIGR02543 family)